jgi:CRP-like cAMP-binding protein
MTTNGRCAGAEARLGEDDDELLSAGHSPAAPQAVASDLARQLAAVTRAVVGTLVPWATEADFSEGRPLLNAGEPPQRVFFLTHGLVKVAAWGEADGRENVIALRAATRPIGTLAALAGRSVAYRVEALTSCRTRVVSADVLRRAVVANSALCLLMLEAHTILAIESGCCSRPVDAMSRVERLLKTLATAFGQPENAGSTKVSCPLRHADLALFAGVASETFSRLLAELERGGRLERGRGWFRLLAPDSPVVRPPRGRG